MADYNEKNDAGRLKAYISNFGFYDICKLAFTRKNIKIYAQKTKRQENKSKHKVSRKKWHFLIKPNFVLDNS